MYCHEVTDAATMLDAGFCKRVALRLWTSVRVVGDLFSEFCQTSEGWRFGHRFLHPVRDMFVSGSILRLPTDFAGYLPSVRIYAYLGIFERVGTFKILFSVVFSKDAVFGCRGPFTRQYHHMATCG